MASGILQRDFVLNGVDEKTDWHGKTRVLGRAIQREDIPAIECRDLYLADGRALSIDGKPWRVMVTTDDELPVAKPFSESFSVFDAHAGWQWLHEILAGTGFKIARAGMLWNRSTWFYSVELSELNAIARPGTVLNLNIANGLDGSLSRGAELSETRVVCANTLSLSRFNGERLFCVKNTKNASFRMESQRKEIEKAVGMAAVWRATVESLENTACEVQSARELYAGQVGRESAEKLSTAAENKVNGLVSLFQRGIGNNGRTLGDVLNGFTEYGTRGFAGSKKDVFTRIESAEFGGLADDKAAFARALSDSGEREKLRAHGKTLLAMSN